MVLDAVMSVVAVLISGFFAIMVMNTLSNTLGGLGKTLAGVAVFIACMAGARPILTHFFGQTLDATLQKDPAFGLIKQKYPQRYAVMLEQLKKTHQDNPKMTAAEALIVVKPMIEPIINERIAMVSDQTRSEFATAAVSYYESLKYQPGTLCYDSIVGKVDYTPQNIKTLEMVADQSHLDEVLIKVLNDESRDKAIVASSESKKVGEALALHLAKKYQQDFSLLQHPDMLSSTEDKKKLCDISIEMMRYLNQPDDPAKMASLRLLMSGKSIL